MTTLEQQAPIRSNLSLVKDMRPMLKNFECEVIVLQKDGEPTQTREGEIIHRFIVADKTGAILLNVWGLSGQYIKGGDILHIIGGICKVRKGQLFISTIRSSKIRRIGQDTFPFAEKPNFSEVDYNTIMNTPNWPNNNTSMLSQQQDQDQQMSQQQQQQQNLTRPHNRGHPYRGGRLPRGGRGGNPNKPRYHRDSDNTM